MHDIKYLSGNGVYVYAEDGETVVRRLVVDHGITIGTKAGYAAIIAGRHRLAERALAMDLDDIYRLAVGRQMRSDHISASHLAKCSLKTEANQRSKEYPQREMQIRMRPRTIIHNRQ